MATEINNMTASYISQKNKTKERKPFVLDGFEEYENEYNEQNEHRIKR